MSVPRTPMDSRYIMYIQSAGAPTSLRRDILGVAHHIQVCFQNNESKNG